MPEGLNCIFFYTFVVRTGRLLLFLKDYLCMSNEMFLQIITEIKTDF